MIIYNRQNRDPNQNNIILYNKIDLISLILFRKLVVYHQTEIQDVNNYELSTVTTLDILK